MTHEEFKAAVRKRLRSMGSNLSGLAEYLGMTRQAVGVALNRPGSIKMKVRIARALNMPVDDALSASGCDTEPMGKFRVVKR